MTKVIVEKKTINHQPDDESYMSDMYTEQTLKI